MYSIQRLYIAIILHATSYVLQIYSLSTCCLTSHLYTRNLFMNDVNTSILHEVLKDKLRLLPSIFACNFLFLKHVLGFNWLNKISYVYVCYFFKNYNPRKIRLFYLTFYDNMTIIL